MFRQILVVLCLVFLGLANALSIEKRIINGMPAKLFEFPSIGSLRYLGHHFCGAVLVGGTKVLTAAHCVNSTKAEQLSVVFGAVDINGHPYQQSRSVANYVEHEQYYVGDKNESYNDIAMITLATPVDNNRMAIPATLAPPGLSFIGQTCIIAGWGNTRYGNPFTLRKAYITNIPNDECARWFKMTGVITSNHICVFAKYHAGENAPAVCDGDSGGPLYCGKNFEYVAGLTAWANKTCTGRIPSVYTRVSEYMDWIIEHM